jgi:hypothetical protein
MKKKYAYFWNELRTRILLIAHRTRPCVQEYFKTRTKFNEPSIISESRLTFNEGRFGRRHGVSNVVLVPIVRSMIYDRSIV